MNSSCRSAHQILLAPPFPARQLVYHNGACAHRFPRYSLAINIACPFWIVHRSPHDDLNAFGLIDHQSRTASHMLACAPDAKHDASLYVFENLRPFAGLTYTIAFPCSYEAFPILFVRSNLHSQHNQLRKVTLQYACGNAGSAAHML